jgi:hypothetical protein
LSIHKFIYADGKKITGVVEMQRASGRKLFTGKRLIEKNHLHTICTSGNCLISGNAGMQEQLPS